MNKSVLITLTIISSFQITYAQKPKLLVGIVVDQMSQEYLHRFRDDFAEGGFNKLMREGFVFHNTFYNYIPTYTGPGHASIYTGTTPALHGIAGNGWFDRASEEMVYCVADDQVRPVGCESDAAMRSPYRLYGATITDMLKLQSHDRSMVVGVALKDRSAILPVGRKPDAAYWWDDESGNWVTSTYYMGSLPDWVEVYNKTHRPESYLDTWKLSIDKENLKQYAAHDKYEEAFAEGGTAEFPYDLKKLATEKGISVLKSTPFGNDFTFDFAETVMREYHMGEDEVTDFLAISFSSTDYVGHRFGPYSAEVEDTYRKFDQRLAAFLSLLDEEIGEENYTLFLTADHGVMPNAAFLKEEGFEVEQMDLDAIEKEIDSLLRKAYGQEKLLIGIGNGQVYLDHPKLEEFKIKQEEAARKVATYLMKDTRVQVALSSHDLLQKEYTDFPRKQMQKGFHKDRSGDVVFVLKPYFEENKHNTGAGHGKPYNFDTHVPLIFFGSGIKKGESHANTEITQVAPTLADILSVQRPPACTDESLYDLIHKN